jgi:polyisoprenoid-binding protein YceI
MEGTEDDMMLKALLVIVASTALPVYAQECYSVDGSRGAVTYEVRQAGAPFRGAFRRFGGELCFAAGRPARIEVWLEPASVNSGLPEVDAALRDREFFAATQYPRATYTSESVELRGSTQIAHGMLQLKGKRRAVDVPFTMQQEGAGLTVSGTVALNRLDYDVGTGEWANTSWLSGDVKVDFRAALSRK